jgi:hypothetical protein
MNDAEPEEMALWRALRLSVLNAPQLGVTAIGPKPATMEDEIRVTIGGQRFSVYIEHVTGE